MFEEASKPRTPPKIPGYRIEGVVGRGATGIVYRARQESVDRFVALKVLYPELVGAKSAELRLQREARATARLAHPNIISAIDMGEVDGVWWYAMELVDGVSLSERLRERPLTEREALRMFIPLCDALQHAFERGVVHRDIKPANILIDKTGRALLVDLGLAFAEDDPLLTKSGGTVGTPHYISPEQARDPSSADVQSDIWSLGATMYHSVCGGPPFSGESVAEILSSVLYARVPDPAERCSALSKGFVLVLRKCLTRERTKRYTTPAELSADLERLRERRAPRITRRGLEPVARKKRAFVRAVVAPVLGALALVAAWWIAGRVAEEPRLAAETVERDPGEAPLARLERRASAEQARLSDLLAEADRLRSSPAVSPADVERAEALHTRLYQRLEGELWSLKREAEEELARRLDANEFERAEAFASREFARQTEARIGTAALPERMRKEFEVFAGHLVTRVRDARATSESSLGAGLDRHYTEKILPRVDELQSRSRWREARALLTTEASSWISEAPVNLNGHAQPVVDRALSALRAKLAARREALDAAWSEVDLELKAWVEARVHELETALSERITQAAAAELRASFDAELARKNLTIEDMPLGLLHLAHEELEKGAKSLAALEQSLGEKDARLRLGELEQETLPMWRERRYAEIARAFESETGEGWRTAVRPTTELRAREARALEELLVRAARGVSARDGELVDLRVGSIVLSGKLTAGTDPLGRGFTLKHASGRTYSLSLRNASNASTEPSRSDAVLPTPLNAEAVELLAGLALAPAAGTARPGGSASPSGSGSPGGSVTLGASAPLDPAHERLLQALFRFREGAPDSEEGAVAAQNVLNGGPLPRGDALLADLESRIAQVLSKVERTEGERRERALSMLYLLRRELPTATNREGLKRRADELIAGYADVLQSSELSDARRIRDELFAESRPSTRDDFVSTFHPDAVEFVGTTRARMRFAFNRRAAGSFDPGAWNADGVGWSAGRFAKSDQELIDRAAPCLALRDPLRVQADAVDVRLELELLPDAPPELLLVSVAGFNVVLTGAKDGNPPRCFVDSGAAADALAQVRAGAGREFNGLIRGLEAEVRVTVNRARGTASVEVDGRKIADVQRLVPRDDAAATTLCVRSWEPVRLLQATIEGARR